MLERSFDRVPLTFGASADCDVVLSDDRVSWEHARISVSGGRLELTSVGRNGCSVGGERVAGAVLVGRDVQFEITPFVVSCVLRATGVRRETSMIDAVALPAAVAPAATLRSDPRTQPVPVPAAPAAAAAPEWLLIRGEAQRPAAVREILLEANRYVLGRGDKASVRVQSVSVSRNHAELTRTPAGTWEVRDMGSANGLFLDGSRITTATLRAGSEIQLGPEVWIGLRIGQARPGQPVAARTAPTPAFAADATLRPPAARRPQRTPPVPPGPGTRSFACRVRPARGDPRAVVIEVDGRLDAFSYTELRDHLKALAARGDRAIVDLSRTRFVDQGGLAVLVQAHGDMGNRLALVGVSESLRDEMVLSRVDALLRRSIHESEAAAVRFLGGRS